MANARYTDDNKIVYAPIGINTQTRITAIQYNPYNPYEVNVEVGDYAPDILDVYIDTDKKIAKAISVTDLQEAITNATNKITGNDGGYVVLYPPESPREILVMNTPSKDTATKIWRFNASGLGYSSTGYNGSYGLAMTMDGAIVADYITTGTLSAINIMGCTIKSGYMGNGSTGFTINDKAIVNGKTAYNETANDGVYVGVDGIGLGKGKFYVTAAGDLVATSAKISGRYDAVFSGTISDYNNYDGIYFYRSSKSDFNLLGGIWYYNDSGVNKLYLSTNNYTPLKIVSSGSSSYEAPNIYISGYTVSAPYTYYSQINCLSNPANAALSLSAYRRYNGVNYDVAQIELYGGISNSSSIKFTSSRIGFFGASPVVKQNAYYMVSSPTLTDLQQLINWLVDVLSNYGLVNKVNY